MKTERNQTVEERISIVEDHVREILTRLEENEWSAEIADARESIERIEAMLEEIARGFSRLGHTLMTEWTITRKE